MSRNSRNFSRRRFVQNAGAGAALFTIVPRHVFGAEGQPAANDKINVAGIGVGGQGWGDIRNSGGENIVGLCDVDDNPAGNALQAACTSVTLPMAPSQIHSQNVRIEPDEWPWFPNCVTTLLSWAAFMSWRISWIEWASGFSQ